jgi:predicted nucleotidyltransferase
MCPSWRRRGQDGPVTSSSRRHPTEASSASVVHALQQAGARFAYLHGSQVAGAATPASDLDVAAWFGRAVDSWVVAGALPDDVDLLVLDTAPLELAGRVAMYGQLLLDLDPPQRIAWEATTRKIYLDELPRVRQARRDFVQSRRRG